MINNDIINLSLVQRLSLRKIPSKERLGPSPISVLFTIFFQLKNYYEDLYDNFVRFHEAKQNEGGWKYDFNFFCNFDELE